MEISTDTRHLKVLPLKHCPSCETGGNYPPEVTLCPLCGTPLKDKIVVENNDRVELLIPFAAAQCPACGMATLLKRNRQCAGCGANLSEEARSQKDEAVKRRQNTFKAPIERLKKRLEESALLQPNFTRNGKEIPLADYINNIFKASLDTATTLIEDVRIEMVAVTWDPLDPNCISSFQQIMNAIDKVIDLVTTLIYQLPPLELRALHRTLTRTIGKIIAGYIKIIEALIAADPDEALERQREGQQLFTDGTHILQSLPRIMDRVSKQASPGWWMSGDNLDLAVIAWEGVKNTLMAIDQAADLVRSALTTIPGVAELSDAEALFLLPATVLPVTIADPILLQERASLIRDVVVRADSSMPDWIVDPDELVLRIGDGIRAVNEQVERVGFLAISPYSRRMTIQLLADVYLNLVEGPLRDFGNVVVIARRAGEKAPNGKYIPEIARGVQSGNIVQDLEHIGAPWHDAIRMLIRNAGAHAGVRVLDDGVILTQRKIKSGIVVDEKTMKMSDAEFAEEFARMSETCLALQLGVIPWLFTHKSKHIVQAILAVKPTQRECEGIVRLLAGLQGLLNVVIEYDGDALIVRAATSEGIDASSPSITYLVPAIFNSWTDINTVTLNIGSRSPVTYERAELPGVNPLVGSRDLVAIKMMGRKWLGDLSGNAAIAADITYLIQPQIMAVSEAIEYVNMSPTSLGLIVEAHTYLVALKKRLQCAQLPPSSTPLVSESREAVRVGVWQLARLRDAFMGTDTREQQRQIRSCTAFVSKLKNINQRADDEFIRVKENDENI